MSRIFLTGGTGLVGSATAKVLLESGYEVRALVRPRADPSPLLALGVDTVPGDITDPDSLHQAGEGCEAVIHSAALRGIGPQDKEDYRRTNVTGTTNVLDVARDIGMRRAVIVTTYGFFDRHQTLTERSPLDSDPPSDPYTQTKMDAHQATLARVADGQDAVLLSPGAMFGPSPLGQGVINLPGANQRLVRALQAVQPVQERHLPILAPWSYTQDVALSIVAALERGVPGELYLALGRPDGVETIAGMLNRALQLGGCPHRVGELAMADLDDPEVLSRFGPALVNQARMSHPEPFFDSHLTTERLGHQPLALDDGLTRTIEWIRSNSFS